MYKKWMKSFLDIVFSLLGIVISLPIFLMIGLIIKLGSEGPIIFKQERIGKDGKPFVLYKYRTMVKNAPELLEVMKKENLKEYEENYKFKNDYRITRIGKILRKTSIDELPQLFNVLKGDMSLIGPRPVLEEETLKYGINKMKLLSIKPGITGAWACNGRNDITYEERMNLELTYVDTYNFLLDIKITILTVICILRKTGR